MPKGSFPLPLQNAQVMLTSFPSREIPGIRFFLKKEEKIPSRIKMKLKKRGAVEVQFNWIFILIIGAVILLFFGVIIAKQRSAADSQNKKSAAQKSRGQNKKNAQLRAACN